MALFNDFFGKEEIAQLKKQLSEKNDENFRLSSQVAQLTSTRDLLENELSKRSQIVDEKINELEKATGKIRELKYEIQSLASDFEILKSSASIQHHDDLEVIASLQRTLEEAKSYVAAANKERDEVNTLLASMRDDYSEKNRLYLERESKLAEKSEKLQIERQKFQQQVSDLHKREQEWKHRIEPKISQYTAHLSLDEKIHQIKVLQAEITEREDRLQQQEDDLNRRSASDLALRKRENEIQELELMISKKEMDVEANASELKHRESDLDNRTSKLESWARELFGFQRRVDQLDNELEQFTAEKIAFQEKIKLQQDKHAERLAEIRRLKSEFTKDVRALNQREHALKEREKEIKRDEKKLVDTKNKNFSLQQDIKELQAQLKEYSEIGAERDELQQSKEALSEQFEGTKSALLHPTVLSWLFEVGKPGTAGIEHGYLGISGSGPWEHESFTSSLEEIGYTFYPLTDDELEYIIVGRFDWSASDLRDLIDARQGLPLRIYSQEMFLAKLATGRDPFDSEKAGLLDAFSEDHPALQFLRSLPDPWPNLSIKTKEKIIVIDDSDFGISESPLHILGYHVGRSSKLSEAQRRKILTECFEAKKLAFSDDSSADYMAKWGRPSGAQRLYRIATHIQSLIRRKDHRKLQAHADWVSDFKWLKNKYYSKYKKYFSWPGAM